MVVISHLFSFSWINFRGRCDFHKSHLPLCRAIYFPTAPSHEDFLAHIMAVNDPDFVACLDIGHAEMRGLHTSAEQMALTLGSHLQALHIHDNDLLNDNHQIPFSMKIDFEQKINYKGYFTLEADAYLRGVSDAETSAGLRNLALAARKLADRYEELS